MWYSFFMLDAYATKANFYICILCNNNHNNKLYFYNQQIIVHINQCGFTERLSKYVK